jgi:archaellum component FlaG (FlaF/FlaG flagellin family)
LVPVKAPGSASAYASVDAEDKMVFYIKNQGTADAPASYTGVKVLATGHQYYLSTPAIPAGDTVETQQLVPDCGPSAGDCNLEITADYNEQVDESSETNNTVTWTLPR